MSLALGRLVVTHQASPFETILSPEIHLVGRDRTSEELAANILSLTSDDIARKDVWMKRPTTLHLMCEMEDCEISTTLAGEDMLHEIVGSTIINLEVSAHTRHPRHHD